MTNLNCNTDLFSTFAGLYENNIVCPKQYPRLDLLPTPLGRQTATRGRGPCAHLCCGLAAEVLYREKYESIITFCNSVFCRLTKISFARKLPSEQIKLFVMSCIFYNTKMTFNSFCTTLNNICLTRLTCILHQLRRRQHVCGAWV